WKELSLALIQQVFLLPDEENHLLGIEYVITAHEYWVQDDELLKVLHSLLAQKQEQQMVPNALQQVETLARYLDASLKEQRQEQILLADLLLTYVTSVPSFTKRVIAYLYRQRASANRSMKAHQLALADFDQALSCNPDDVSVYNGRGETYRLMGQYEK